MIAFCIGFMLGGMFGMFLTAIVAVSDFDEGESIEQTGDEVPAEVREAIDGSRTIK